MKSSVKILRIETDMEEKRIDVFLKQEFSEFSRSFIQKLIQKGEIVVNEKKVKPSYLLKRGDTIKINVPVIQDSSLIPEALPLNIIYEDEFLLVINKPAGMLTHPVRPGQTGTMVNALLYHSSRLSEIGKPLRPGIVHRLDKDTSGIIVVAKDDYTHLALSIQFKKREVKKKYKALVRGIPQFREGFIDHKIASSSRWGVKRLSQDPLAKYAITRYKLLKSWNSRWSLLEIYPLTGRTHQIRVHLRTLNCFLIGDRIYGGKPGRDFPLPVSRALLHAEFLGFFHPEKKRWVEFEAFLPEDMCKAIDYLEKNYEATK